MISYFLSFVLVATSSFFDFSVKNIQNNFLPYEKSLEIEVLHEIPSEITLDRFKVRPVVSRGFVSILNKDKKWIDSHSLWNDFPKLDQNYNEINVNPANLGFIDLKLEIQDTKTGKVYSTSQKRLWDKNMFKPYINSLNENILKPK